MTRRRLSSRSLIAPLALALIAGFAASAQAQAPGIKKVPGGPFVVPSNPTSSIPAGQTIDWTISITNFSPNPLAVTFVDEVQNPECETGGAGASQENAPQTDQFFEDTGDGTCGARVNGAIHPGTDCDLLSQRLTIPSINIPTGATRTITFTTRISATANPGDLTCNWGKFFNPTTGAPLQRTQDPNRSVDSCTCLRITAPSGLDFEATKEATPDVPRLIPGDPASTITYTIKATNTGTDDITNATLSDTLGAGLEWVSLDPAVTFVDCPPPLTCNVTSLTQISVTGYDLAATDPDTSLTIVARARVTCDAATDDDTGVVCNQGNFRILAGTFPTDDPTEPGGANPTCVPVIWSNLTQSQKVVSGYDDTAPANGQLDQGERVHYTIRARNEGSYRAAAVEVTDTLDACLSGPIIALDGGVVAGNTITWNVGDLAPSGGQANVRFSAILAVDASCCNQASLNSEERIACGQGPILTDDPATSAPNDPTCISPGPQPDLRVTKTVELVNDLGTPGQIDVGDGIRWTITVENVGAGPATGAALNDVLSLCNRDFGGAPLTQLSTDDPLDPNAGTDNSTPSQPPITPGVIQVDNLGGANGIQPGETITIQADATVQGQVSNCCNQATVTYAERSEPEPSDDPSTPGLVDDATCLQPPAPEPRGRLVKTADPKDGNTNGEHNVGETVTYTLEFTNTGSVDLTNIVINDPSSSCIAIDTDNVVVSPGGVDSSAGGTVDVTFPGPLAPAGVVTVTFSATSLVEGLCCNQATWIASPGLSGTSDDGSVPIPSPDTCHQVEPIVADTRDASVEKFVMETGCLDPGSTVRFRVVVRNIGTQNIPSFTLTDPLRPGGFNNVVVTPPLVHDPGTNTVSLASGGPLGPGLFAEYFYQADLPCDETGSLTNTVTMDFSGTGGPEQRTDSVSVNWGVPDVTQSTKDYDWADTDTDGLVDAGETITYTLRISNAATASCPADQVVVTDVLDASFDDSTLVIGNGGTYAAVTRTITWDPLSTPGLGSIAPGATVVLTFDIEVSAAIPTDPGRLIQNEFTVNPTGNSTAACPGLPGLVKLLQADRTIPYGNVQFATQDLLRNADVTNLQGAYSILPTTVFTSETPNASTCGVSDLNPTSDLFQADVQAALEGAGVIVPGDAVPGGTDVLVFYEVTERCQPIEEGGTDDFICVRKQGVDVVIRASANPTLCN